MRGEEGGDYTPLQDLTLLLVSFDFSIHVLLSIDHKLVVFFMQVKNKCFW